MPMRLFIAEKPELARAIAEGLGGGKRKEGYFDCGDDRVAWCYGHMLQLLDPEDYDPRHRNWNMDTLPIVNIPWRRKPAGDAAKQAQLEIIVDLLKAADSVVHAGDPDEEGQLLVDEILDHAGCRVPVARLLINDNNIKVVRRQLGAMGDNRAFAALSAAAEARSVGDQLYGFNLTRGYTLAARAGGYQGLVSVGRVQTPVLGLVVRRCRESAAHKPAYYYTVAGQFEFAGICFSARYRCESGDPVDAEGRLSDVKHAARIAAFVGGQPARIVSAATSQAVTPPPLPYNLLKLQIDAARKFGLKPGEVKEITQALREKHRLITYNRSDCQYLSDEQHADAPAVLAAVARTAPALAGAAERADPALRGRAFNSAKVSAHHAIVPTQCVADLAALTEREQNVYQLVARAYVAQFWPEHRHDSTELLVETAGHRFAVRAAVTTAPGWRELYTNDTGNEELEDGSADMEADLRALAEGQTGECVSARADRGETRPPALYTMPSLLLDLTRVARYIRDERLREILIAKDDGKEGEHGGIGTPATRDTIIATLFQRGYLIEKRRQIIATPQGEALYDVLPDAAKYPDMTAIWHEQQAAIRAGAYDVTSFIQELVEHIADEIAAIRKNGLVMAAGDNFCPSCGKPLRRIPRKGRDAFFWGCSGYAAGCTFTCSDRDGQPDLARLQRGSSRRRRRRSALPSRKPAGAGGDAPRPRARTEKP
jgi:DNA topoisomerase III